MAKNMGEEVFSNICRACMTETGVFQSIFMADETTGTSIHLAEMIMTYASVQITLGDGLPEQICTSCAEKVSELYLFKMKCEETDVNLRAKLGRSPLWKPYSIAEEQQQYNTAFDLDDDTVDVIIKPEVQVEYSEPAQTMNEDTKNPEVTIEELCEEAEKVALPKIIHKFERVKNFVYNTGIIKTPNDELFIEPIFLVKSPGGVKEEMRMVEEDAVEIHPLMGENAAIEQYINLNGHIECTLCSFICITEQMYQDHLAAHARETKSKHVCELCGKRFTKNSHLTRHIKTHDTVKPYSCPQCHKCYAHFEQLSNHMNIHSGIKPHVCKICSKGFNQISNLKDHMRTHNGEKPFLCSMCGKGFNQLGNLRQHTVRHSGIKAHLCNVCGNGFASKGELGAHLRKHTGARPFVCPVCSHGFTTSSSLTKHKRIHSGEKPYECDVCKMKFSRSGILARHKRTHTGEKPYMCKFCAKAFSQSNDLSSHLRIHTGEKPYICDICGQAFRQSSAMKTHKKTHIDKTLLDTKVVMSMMQSTFLTTMQ